MAKTSQSMILDMLKTPQQVREEQLAKMRQQSAAQAQLLAQPVRGTTALPGLLSRFAAGEAMEQRVDLDKAARRAAGAAGSGLGMLGETQAAEAVRGAFLTPEERLASASRQIVKGIDLTDPVALKQASMKLQQAGNLQAAETLSNRATALQTKASELALRKREVAAKESQAESAAKQATAAETKALTNQQINALATSLGVSPDVLDNATADSAAKAAQILNSPLIGPETVEGRRNRALGALVQKSTGGKTVYDLTGLGNLFSEQASRAAGKEAGNKAEEGFINLQQKALAGVNILRDVRRTQNALNEFEAAGGQSGTFEGIRRQGLAVLRGFGVDLTGVDETKLDQAEFVDFMANKALTNLAGTFKGSQSEKELRAIQGMTPEMRRQPATLRRIFDILQTEAYADQYIYNAAKKYKETNTTNPGTAIGFDPVDVAIDFNRKYNEYSDLATKISAGTATPSDQERFLELGEIIRGGQ